jgi:diguanylate cyclase (GGDEF)-like protein
MAPEGGREDARARAIVVDDEPMNLELLERSLRRKYIVLAAPSPERALEILRAENNVALVISDYRMPGMNGAELLAKASKLHPHAKRVIITGYADADNVITAINEGQIHYLVKKPWKHQELHQILDQLVHAWVLEHENRKLISELRTANDELRSKERLLVRNLDEKGRDLLSATRELERINRELEVLSYKDGLTGLYNHRAFQERLGEELARARRYGQPLTLLYGDIDHFATLNRELGYQLGDEILRRVAAVMCDADSHSRVRASDIVARYSGEEFVLLLPETSKEGAVVKGERLLSAIANASYPAGRDITMSFGIASFPDDANTADKLVRCAEAAQQAAKQNGRNQVHLYSAGGVNPRRSGSGPSANGTPVGDEEFPNHYEKLPQIVAMMMRDRAVSCLYVDLNRLRRIERELGVAQHAELFLQAGHMLDGMRGDSLRQNDLVCRTEDDDAYICVLAPSRKDDENSSLEGVAARVQKRLEHELSPLVRDLVRDSPRVNVGFARVLNNSMVRPERLISRLVSEARESALLQRNRASQADKTLLQEIILNEQLTPVYQPIVHLQTGAIFGFEALIRGPRDTSLESPASLFSVADEVGLTFELDRACFRSALRGAVGLEPIHRLFVNLLPLSFYDSSFIETEVSHLLDAAALTPANVVFEITERLAIENFTSFRRALARYTAMGFGVAIDDVGTKHANLETVMALRPHLIKISDVLTRGVSRSTVKREMMNSLGRIAEAIDAVIVAEGIETPDDLVVLHDLGVRYGQGFFLARPGPPFPRLRSSVRRAVSSMATTSRDPIPAPPADEDPTDPSSWPLSSKEIAVATREGAEQVLAAGSATALRIPDDLPDNAAEGHDDDEEQTSEKQPGSPRPSRADTSSFHADAVFDEFSEKTRPHTGNASNGDQGWKPVSLEELGADDDGESEAIPLLESLRRTSNEGDDFSEETGDQAVPPN